MAKFWNWCKSFFVKVDPIVQRIKPAAIIIAKAANPKLTPGIDVAQAAISALKGAQDQKA